MCTVDGDMARCEYEEMAPEHAKSRHDDSGATCGMLSDAHRMQVVAVARRAL